MRKKDTAQAADMFAPKKVTSVDVGASRINLCFVEYSSRRKYCEAKHSYFGINFQIAIANLWAGVIYYIRNWNRDYEFL